MDGFLHETTHARSLVITVSSYYGLVGTALLFGIHSSRFSSCYRYLQCRVVGKGNTILHMLVKSEEKSCYSKRVEEENKEKAEGMTDNYFCNLTFSSF
ncbi:hypothetical protein SLE2022_268060 [Rubroshorea leprosula]